ncbi:camphor resistance protein CrcB [Fontimonas thermophila]|uniref:Fluoride-specific ion channel FluC n=1 Tax=Fontimonas thermophila TaxID=1076937 RepID=A0A1I2IDL1_9GAMM|nr:fluoride efflux transporter CrcB [Fontimonas thermophila]SFF40429.1 camphor resistance protein CrcB [Fontimonas thermophila]
MMQWLAVALGGALGALARFGIVRLLTAWFGPAFPLGTLTVNVAGSLAAGLLYVRLVEQGATDGVLCALLIVGFLGAFTTFSAFSVETLRLLEDVGLGAAALNVALNLVLCLAACGLGLWIGRAYFA